MISKKDIRKVASETLQLEAEAIVALTQQITEDFDSAVQTILDAQGRVIITGVGKSAIIAQKIVATLNSTGTPSIFMHAADAVHGDLGIIQENDLVMALSKSGNTAEIKVLIPLIKQRKVKIIALVGDLQSYLAQQADFVINCSVEREACPNNLAPTTSTTAQLAMGDAIAMCLLHARSFSDADFARYHPGGSLGKKLYLKVSDLSSSNEKPLVTSQDGIRKVILEITRNRLGAVAVLEENELKGIITDGDLRRMLESYADYNNLKAIDIMNADPKTIEEDHLAAEALQLMRTHHISQLIATDSGGLYQGIIHLHDLVREGIL